MSEIKISTTILNNYRIDKSIGQGAFGEVYLATHTVLNGKRAVKVLLRNEIGIGSSDYEEFRNRFRQESQLMEWFNHPNIIRVYDFQEEEKILFLIMEYADGGSLRQRMDHLKQEGRFLSVEETVRVGIDIANGLAALHHKDVVHRDLKPSNILFDADGRAKVADLGLAQVPGGASMRSQLSVAKPHPGTPAYMSPEQETAGSYLRPASDVYALGLILFEMLTSRGYKSLRPGTRLKSLSPDAPDWLDDLLARMLSENPKERPWDGAETAVKLIEHGFEQAPSSPTKSATEDHSSRIVLPDMTSDATVGSTILQNSTNFKVFPKKVPVKPLEPIPIDQKTDKFSSLLQKSWYVLIPAIIILGAIYIYLLINNINSEVKTSPTAVLPQNLINLPTSTVAKAINYKSSILGKWIVTESINDPDKQRPAWQDIGNTMEFLSNGQQKMTTFDGFISGTPYRIDGDRVYFKFNDGREDVWKITFYNYGNTMVLRKVDSMENFVLSKK